MLSHDLILFLGVQISALASRSTILTNTTQSLLLLAIRYCCICCEFDVLVATVQKLPCYASYMNSSDDTSPRHMQFTY